MFRWQGEQYILLSPPYSQLPVIFQHLCGGGKGIMGLSVEMHGNATKVDTDQQEPCNTHALKL